MTARPVGDGDGHDELRDDALRAVGLKDADRPLTGAEAALVQRVTAWAEERARERAAAIVARVKALPVYEVKDDDDLLGHVILAQDAIDALAADDRTGQR